MPFTTDAFFDVFARYNQALWPAVVGLWLVTAAILGKAVIAPDERMPRVMTWALAGLWLWGGVVYHAGYFTAINPAAWLFAVAFMVEGVALWRAGVCGRSLDLTMASGPWRAVGVAVAVYALLYPALSIAAGHPYPATPTFGVPCPTVLLTVGVFLMCSRVPVLLLVIPFAWTLIGGSAAVLFQVTTDYVLLACAPLLVLYTYRSRRHQPRAAAWG